MKTSNILIPGGLAAAAVLVLSRQASASTGDPVFDAEMGGLTAGASGLATKVGEPSLKPVLVAMFKVQAPSDLGDPATLPQLNANQRGRLAALGVGWELAIAHKLLVSGGMEKPTWQALLLDVFMSMGGAVEANAPALVEQVLAEAKVDPLLAPKFGKFPYNAKDAIAAAGLNSLPAVWKTYLESVMKVP